MSPQRAFISAPYLSNPESVQVAGFVIAKEGMEPVFCSPRNPGCDPEETRRAISSLLGCQVIVMLPGWEHDRCCRHDLDLATRLDLQIEFIDGHPDPNKHPLDDAFNFLHGSKLSMVEFSSAIRKIKLPKPNFSAAVILENLADQTTKFSSEAKIALEEIAKHFQ